MKKSSTTMTIKRVRLYVEFFYTKGEPGFLTGAPEDCYPEEPAMVDIEGVYIGNEEIEVYNLLSEAVIKKIEDYILENAGE
jgi:hypothetical protein